MRPMQKLAMGLLIISLATLTFVNHYQARVIAEQRATIRQLSQVPFCPAPHVDIFKAIKGWNKGAKPSPPKRKKSQEGITYQRLMVTNVGNPLGRLI